MNKVIFLDFDGVLNNAQFMWKNTNPYPDYLMPKKVELLNILLDRTDANIVFSTSWREEFSITELVCIMERAGFRHGDRCIGSTITTMECDRAYEIKSWVEGRKVDSYAIVDDNIENLEGQLHKTVHINGTTGLMPTDIDLILAMLE